MNRPAYMLESTFSNSKSPFSLSSLEREADNMLLASTLFKSHNIHFTRDVFDESNSTLDHLLRDKSALFVVSETVSQLYGHKINRFLESRKSLFQSKIIFIKTGEHNKNLQTLSSICEKASEFSLKRHHPLVAVGGGICTDICGLAATLFRRGVPHIKIPTTFVGLIDAGIATKNGVNLGNRKNLLGTFSPPSASVIDPLFLASVPLRHIICGVAESIKMGLVVDSRIYRLWREQGEQLCLSRLQNPTEAREQVIKRSIFSMLNELSDNLYEHNTYKRAVDFGHTFSQHIEEVSEYQIYHGEAVSIDMAISCQISHLLGFLETDALEEILTLFQTLKLPLYSHLIKVDDLWESLSSIVVHRGGNLNLVIPKSIGSCEFLETLADLKKSCLKEALDRLSKYEYKKKDLNASLASLEQEVCLTLV